MNIRFVNYLIVLFLSLPFFSISQVSISATQSAESLSMDYSEKLSEKFTDYKVISIDVAPLLEQLGGFDDVENIVIPIEGEESWSMQLVPQNTLVSRMVVRTASGVDHTGSISVFPYAGHIYNEQSTDVRLTIAEDFLYVYIEDGINNRFLEPLSSLVAGAPKGLFVVYNGHDVKFPEGATCASTHTANKSNEIKGSIEMKSTGLCLEVEVATASDWLMFQNYGQNVTTLTNHNVGVMNNVQLNYDDEFDDEIFFVIVEQFISDCSTCDPWTNNTAAGTLLNSFRNWGPGGFSQTHDIGQLWTDRDLDGTTIGIAYVGVVCTGSRYQVLQDFSSNANLKRVMVAHETGHNFDAVQNPSGHDPSGSAFIMAPSVSNVSVWSAASIGDIEAHYNSRNCLAACAPPAPPIAGFTSSLQDICPGTTVQFFDNSTAGPTAWSWSFPGGTPSSSSLENPTVTYNSIGTYNVSLTATNGSGSNSTTIPGFITVSNSGTDVVLAEDFTGGLGNFTVVNPDGGNTWETVSVAGATGSDAGVWIDNHGYNGGQGQLDGLHSQVFDLSGRNSINLEVEYAYARYNSQFSDIFRIKVSTDGGNTFPFTEFVGQENGSGNFATVADQTAAFAPADGSEWCLGSTTNASCISLDLSAYADENNVVLRFENESGFGNNLYLDNIIVTSSCQVVAPPVTQFTSDVSTGCAPLIVSFQDQSTNGPQSWNWSFPGGIPATSTQQNPVVNYATQGTYPVTLVTTNAAGSDTYTLDNYVNVFDVPESSFISIANGQVVSFSNTSTDATFFNWNFGDGENSTEENPVHQYDEDGTYIVTLIAGNICGTDTYQFTVTVASLPIAFFSADQTSGCANLVVNFLNESSNNSDSFLWTFEGGSPASSTSENPTIEYGFKGVYGVTLVVTNEQGQDELVLSSYITVEDVPVTNFSALENDNVVDFTNLSQDADAYFWEFGDGGNSNQINPTHTYMQDGLYSVTLTASNDCGDSEYVGIVNISNLPSAAFSSDITTGCEDLTVQFLNQSSSNSESFLWSFPGGSPSTSTQENPLIVYDSPGIYDVILIVTNEEGSDEVATASYITVQAEPTAGFTSTNNQLNYNFTSTSQNVVSYLWNFGDANTSNMQNPSHTYAEDGTYMVTLEVTNSCGTDVFTNTVTVVSAVTASASANITAGCADFVVQFMDNSSSNVTGWNWSFPGGIPSTSTMENPVVTYNAAGTYSVNLMVSNSEFSDDVNYNEYIIVTDVPDSDFAFDVVDQTVTFDNNTINGTTYEWLFGDNQTSNAVNPSHVYDQEGSYTVTLIATNACGSDTTIIEVNVSSVPTANFSSDKQSGCTDFTVEYSDLSTSNTTSWLWTFEGGNPATSTEQNPVVEYTESGSYDVTLLATNAQGQDSYTLTDYISVSSTPDVQINQNNLGNIVEFSAASTNTDSYEWTVPSLDQQWSGNLVSVEFPADGVYDVILESTNACGTITTTFSVFITAYPDANFEVDNSTGCASFTTSFSDLSEDGVDSYEWIFVGGNPAESTDSNPLITYEMAGTYGVELRVTNQFGSDTIVLVDVVTVLPSPIAAFDSEVVESTVNFTNTSDGASIFDWSFGDSTGSDEENPSHFYELAGDYEVILIVDNGQCQDTIKQVVTILVNDIADFSDENINLYPVPSKDFVILEIKAISSENFKYSIVNALGQTMRLGELNINSGENQIRFDTEFPSGVYFLKLNQDDRQFVKRFIIER